MHAHNPRYPNSRSHLNPLPHIPSQLPLPIPLQIPLKQRPDRHLPKYIPAFLGMGHLLLIIQPPLHQTLILDSRRVEGTRGRSGLHMVDEGRVRRVGAAEVHLGFVGAVGERLRVLEAAGLDQVDVAVQGAQQQEAVAVLLVFDGPH